MSVAVLARAVELAEQGPGRVYACGGETWTDPLVLPGNVSLHGGFDCGAEWAYADGRMRSLLSVASTLAVLWVDGGLDDEPLMRMAPPGVPVRPV